MKNYMLKYFSILIALVCAISCQHSTSIIDENNCDDEFLLYHDFEVSLNRSSCNSDENLKIRFDKLVEDSRCPSGVVCFWEGNAKVKLVFNNEDERHLLKLNTYSGFTRDTVISNYKIKLLNVKPYPIFEKPVNINDYSIFIRLTKIY